MCDTVSCSHVSWLGVNYVYDIVIPGFLIQTPLLTGYLVLVLNLCCGLSTNGPHRLINLNA